MDREASSEIRRMKKCKGDEIPIIAMTANVFAEDGSSKKGRNEWIYRKTCAGRRTL